MDKLNGYLFSKLDRIGSRSEGPEYFLQKSDYKEIRVEKKVKLWEKDPNLHKFLDQKVTIEGEISNDKIVYKKIKGYIP